MEIKIITDKINTTLKRRDVSISVKSKATPSRVDIKNKLAAMMDSKPELIVVNKLNTEFGKQETIGSVGIYEDEEHLKRVALVHLAGRDKVPPPEEEPEAEAAPEGESETESSEGEAVPAAEKEASAEPEPEVKEEAKEEPTEEPEASEKAE